MHWAKSERERHPSLASLSNLACTWFQASMSLFLLPLMNLKPRRAFCAPDFALSCWARCLRSARAASAESMEDGPVFPPCPWLQEHFFNSVLKSSDSCLSYWENWRSFPWDELRLINGGETVSDVPFSISDVAPATAISTPLRTTVSSSWKSRVTSTNSSEDEAEIAGEDGKLRPRHLSRQETLLLIGRGRWKSIKGEI